MYMHAALEERLNNRQSNEVLDKIKQVKGVLSAEFSKHAAHTASIKYDEHNADWETISDNIITIKGVKHVDIDL